MAIIGVRELREQATRILQRVREERAEYIITYQGRPIAVLLPVDTAQVEAAMVEVGRRAVSGGWAAYARLAEEIRRAWPPDRSSQVVPDEVRR
ncbi:MAG: type II toxin-antitoxin system Phd/YefM family antitoxin [Thermoflexia bacterium]|nr:MAG: type II toxin-antitoxin system Phd/YefM family antitoxin [Thermoflexia bacterium]